MRPSVFKLSALGCILGGLCLGAIFPSSGNQHGKGGAVNIVNYGSASPGIVATPTPTITPTPTPSATPSDHVADANARLSLDPTTHPTDTFQVIQDDDGLTYTFNGPGLDADAGLWVTGAGDDDWNGPYGLDTGHGGYDLIAGGRSVEDSGGGIWVMDTNYIITSPDTYPWQGPWETPVEGGGTPPAPTVVRNPMTSPENWDP
jgi:hypothetical protein